jgi:hypothetical protein
MEKGPENADIVAAVHKGGTEGGHCACPARGDDLELGWQWCEGFVARQDLGDGCVGGADILPFGDRCVIGRW